MATAPRDPKFQELKDDLTAVTVTMSDNVKKTLERGVMLDDIDDKTKKLADHAHEFQHQAHAVRQNMCRRNWKMYGLIALIVTVIIAFIVLMLHPWT